MAWADPIAKELLVSPRPTWDFVVEIELEDRVGESVRGDEFRGSRRYSQSYLSRRDARRAKYEATELRTVVGEEGSGGSMASKFDGEKGKSNDASGEVSRDAKEKEKTEAFPMFDEVLSQTLLIEMFDMEEWERLENTEWMEIEKSEETQNQADNLRDETEEIKEVFFS